MKKRAHNKTLIKISSALSKVKALKQLEPNEQGFTLLSLPKKIRRDILTKLKSKEILNIINYLDPDEATDLLQEISKQRRNNILKKLGKEIQEKVEFLLKFNPKTAAGMMSLDYVEVEEDTTFQKIARIIRSHEKRTGKFPAILIVKEAKLIGELPSHTLALARKTTKIAKYKKRVPSVKYNENESEIIAKFKSHPHNKIVVLDEDEKILGIVYSDDILAVIESKSADSLREFASVSAEEDVLDPISSKVKHRYKWLITNLATAFLAASVISLFQDTISSFVYLAAYMPIVAGMGGNAGTQTLVVVVRGIALKEIELKTAKRVLLNEVIAGAINGIITGILVAIIASIWNKNPMLGVIVGVSMMISLMIAGFFGTLIPLIMKKLGKDPATSATIFITTATDVLGFSVFLGLATALLK